MERIKAYNPNIKLIFVFRDPVYRAYSHWNMERQRGFEKDSFSNSIRREGADKDQSRISSYVSRGFYSSQIKHAKSLFSGEQLLFIKQEELLDEPGSALQRVTNFLGLSAMGDVQYKRVHSREYEYPISFEDERFLRDLFRSDIEEVEREVGWDLSDWKKISD
ncbi:sulfotransferase domain-containing protein [Modicisalibacter luteus]|uniref:sulfotransferase domain-containing protein n=1 Tax=Modicisalibacter luteus TaxID=453962 RepID=UPI00362A16DA